MITMDMRTMRNKKVTTYVPPYTKDLVLKASKPRAKSENGLLS